MSLYKGKEISTQKIIDRLVEIAADNGHFLKKCEGCGSIDYMRVITPCHGYDSNHWFCEPCKDDAVIKGLKLCAECPDYEDDYDEEVLERKENINRQVTLVVKDKNEENKSEEQIPSLTKEENGEIRELDTLHISSLTKDEKDNSQNLVKKNLDNKNKKIKDFIHRPEPCNHDELVAHLREQLGEAGGSYLTCDACGWVDSTETFQPCHSESDYFCCIKCHREAEEKGLTLCNEDCGIVICRNCGELVSDDDKVPCCEDSDFYFCQDCATEFEDKNVNLCNLVHPSLENGVLDKDNAASSPSVECTPLLEDKNFGSLSNNSVERANIEKRQEIKEMEIPPQPIQSLPEKLLEEYTPKSPLETKENKPTRLPPLSKTIKNYIYNGARFDPKDQIDIMMKYMEETDINFHHCITCKIVDSIDNFVECHEGSCCYFCFRCKNKAVSKNQVLCNVSCGIEICRKCEKVVSKREQVPCCPGSDFFFCEQCSSSFTSSGVNLCSLVHDDLEDDENLDKIPSNILDNKGGDFVVKINLSA